MLDHPFVRSCRHRTDTRSDGTARCNRSATGLAWRLPGISKSWGAPRLFFGVSAGAMDSMINHYTANKRLRSDDAYTPDRRAGMRPDYPSIVYTKILKELYPDVPIVLGGIEASPAPGHALRLLARQVAPRYPERQPGGFADIRHGGTSPQRTGQPIASRNIFP